MRRKANEQNDNSKRNKRLIYATVAIIIVLIPAVYFYSTSTTSSLPPRAAIIDQLGSSRLEAAIRHENETFIESTEHLLQARFSAIDYYSDNATVEQYASLSSLGYRLIVWRGHSALDDSGYVALASTDKYGFKDYNSYLANDQLALCNIANESSLYFGITPNFIKQVMKGKFTDTVVILMSCNGLNDKYNQTAQAFESKGAKAVISWDNWINPSDNDGAADALLQYLITKNYTIGEAVSQIPRLSLDYGGAYLRYSPFDISNYHIPDYREAAAQTVAPAMLSLFKKDVIQNRASETGGAWIGQASKMPRNS